MEVYPGVWGNYLFFNLPNQVLVDRGSRLGQSAMGGVFGYLSAIAIVMVEKTSIEAHSSLALRERYNQPFQKLMLAYFDLEQKKSFLPSLSNPLTTQ